MARPKKTSDQASTVSVSLRVDPAIKYAIDIAARVQKRTVTGVVEWSVEKALSEVKMPVDFAEHQTSNRPDNVMDAVKELLWSSDEATRLVILASQYPSLLTFEESRIWESIKLSPPFWRWAPRTNMDANPWRNAKLEVISAYWPILLERVQDENGVVQVSYEEAGLPTPLELEERKAQAIVDSSGYYTTLELENDNLRAQNEALTELTEKLLSAIQTLGKKDGDAK